MAATESVHADRMFGLPAHPLFVHLPVVLIPVVSISAVVMVWDDDWRERYGLLVACLALISLGSALAAAEAGEELRHRLFGGGGSGPSVDLIEQHEEAADRLQTFVFLLSIALIVMVGIIRFGSRDRSRSGERHWVGNRHGYEGDVGCGRHALVDSFVGLHRTNRTLGFEGSMGEARWKRPSLRAIA